MLSPPPASNTSGYWQLFFLFDLGHPRHRLVGGLRRAALLSGLQLPLHVLVHHLKLLHHLLLRKNTLVFGPKKSRPAGRCQTCDVGPRQAGSFGRTPPGDVDCVLLITGWLDKFNLTSDPLCSHQPNSPPTDHVFAPVIHHLR